MKFSSSVPILVCFCLCHQIGAAAPAYDFLVIGTPAACALYDQYEQQLSDAKKRAIPGNAPFQIQNEQQLMGDQITLAMRLSLLNSTYYIMLDDKGKPAGLPASVTRYKGCIPFYDTLMVSVPTLPLSQNPAGSGKRTTLQKNEAVVRVFTWHGSTFLLRPGTQPVFGWTSAAKNGLRPAQKRNFTDSADDFSVLHIRIMKRLTEANERYDSLFSYFNGRTHQEKSVPQWIAGTGKERRYLLQGAGGMVEQLENSTSQIVKDVEQMLLGKPYLVLYGQGIITIGPR